MANKKFSCQENRQSNIEYVYDFLDKIFREKSTDVWLKALEEGDIPVTRVNSVADVIDDEHLNSTGFFSIEEHPSEGYVRRMKTPTDWLENSPSVPFPAPAKGQDTATILRSLGYTESEIIAFGQDHC